MRILHLGKYYAPAKGGMETALRHMAEGLLADGHDVRVIVASQGRTTTREDLPDAPGALIRAAAAWTWNSQPLALGLPGILRREIDRFAPDVIHLHTPNPLACWAWLRARDTARRTGATLAVWHHSDIVRQRLGGRLVRPLVQRCLADAAGICVSSEALRAAALDVAPWRDRVAVIPFGIDPTPFAPCRPDPTGPLLFVGRLVAYKGLETLLTAVAAAPGVRLEVVGTGPLDAALRARAAESDLAGRVRFRTDVADADLPAVMAGSSALVLPSRDRSETFGLSLLEAMAAGLPVIASDLPTGVRDLARPGETGWLVPPGDAAALAEALRSCIGDPGQARRRGETGRNLVHERFTRARMARDLAGWYRSLQSQPRP